MQKQFLRALLLLLQFAVTASYGQGQGQRLGGASTDNKMLPGGSPTASSGLSNLYSPSLYDGTANINIPIYQYASQNSDFSVSLSYNTRGVMVSEIASDVGLHFNINAGATISRTTKDLPDEINLLNGDTTMFQWTGQVWMKPIPGFPIPSYDTVSMNPFWAFKGKYTTYSESPASAADTLIYRDKEADDFTVNLGGSSFTFNLGKGGTIFTHPHRGVKVEVLWDGQPLTSIGDLQPIGEDLGYQNLLTFRIRDEQGNSYLFRRGDFEMKQLEDMYGATNVVTNYNFTTRWVIEKVTLASGGEIRYNYQDLTYNGMALPLDKNNSKREGAYPSNNGPDSFTVFAVITKTCKLKDIWYPNNVRVYFNYGSTIREDGIIGALKEIRVTTPQSCLSYIMQQSYSWANHIPDTKPYESGFATTWYVRPGEGDRTLRLRLDGIRLTSCDSSIDEPYYSFTYDQLNLPPRLDHRQDYFGYFNDGVFLSNNPGNIEADAPTLIPRHKRWIPYYPNYDLYDNTQYFMDREPNPNMIRAGILKSIKNAYGGTATFYYSGHQNLTNPMTGLPTDQYYFGKDANDGLRLDSVVEKEPLHPDNAKVTVFQYSGGQRFIAGGYFHSPDRYSAYNNTTPVLANIVLTGRYVTPHQLINGSNHGYSNVTVLTRTGQGILLGRKEVKFSNFKDDGGPLKYFVIGGGKDFYTFPYTDKNYLMDWQMGLPLEVTEYDQNNRIVQKTVNRYRFTIDTTSAIGKVENRKEGMVMLDDGVTGVPGITNVVPRMKITDDYRPYTGAALLDTSITYKYLSDNNYITDVIYYQYDSRNNPSAIFTQNSKGELVRTIQAYNYTVNATAGTTLYNMTAAGLEKPIGTERWLVSSSGLADDKLLEASFTTYDFQDNKLRQKYLYNMRRGQPLTYAQYTGYSGGLPPPGFAQAPLAFGGGVLPNFRMTSNITLADTRSNPLEVQLLGQQLYNSTIWDTLTGQKIAEANARYADIAFSGFEVSNQGNWQYNAMGAVNLTDPIAGRNAYAFSAGPVTRTGLNTGKKYLVSFWATNYSNLPVCSIGGASITLVSGAVKGNWTRYEGQFTAPSSSAILSLSGTSNAYLDELRLIPIEATMQSWAYRGLFGVDATSDASGRITYFEYDKLGRQNIVRDQEGNIQMMTEVRIPQ